MPHDSAFLGSFVENFLFQAHPVRLCHAGNLICVHNYVSFLLTAMNCDNLTDPTNGQVNHTAGTTLGQTATYSCNTGYNLVGGSIRTCQAMGWSGSAPTCQRMLFMCACAQWGKQLVNSFHLFMQT